VTPPGDANALASAVRRLAEDRALCERMGQAARRAAPLFDRARQIAAHASVLREVAKA